MLRKLGILIEKHPWMIVSIILFVTLGFGLLLPSIQFKTEFNDFYPEDEIVAANMRLTKYFGQSEATMLIYVEKDKSESTLSLDSLKEQHYIQKELEKLPEVADSSSIITFIDQICQIEFGSTYENASDIEITIALEDIFSEDKTSSIKILETDDENELIDYNRYPKITKGRSNDCVDIKNCIVSYNNNSLIFSIEVFDLKDMDSNTKSPLWFTNIFEWYIDFQNLIKPDERLDVSYRISAHIEPRYPIWKIGEGLPENIKNILNNIKNRELFNSYKKEVYLWLKPPSEDFYFPLPLNTGEIKIDKSSNTIDLIVSREEISKYGIAPRFGFFELPAKLSNFKAGSRYYEGFFLNLPWLRISSNTSYLFDKLNKIQDKPLISNFANNILDKIAGIKWEKFDLVFNNLSEFIDLPDQIALKDLDYSWVNLDDAPQEGKTSEKILFIRPPLFNTFKISAKSFLSKDFELSGKPTSSLIILNMNISGGYEGLLTSTEKIIKKISDLDSKFGYVTAETTGENVISLEIDQVTNEANQIIMPMILIVIISILFVSFRKISYIILPMVSLVIATVWLFGTMVLIGKPFTTISVALVPLIMGLGVDYSVHLAHNYRTELGKGHTPAEAVKKSVIEIGSAMFLAMLTTVIAFLSFLSASLPPIRDFGILLGLGIFFTFITAITFQSAFRLILDRKKEIYNNRKKRSIKLDVIMGKMANRILNNQKIIIASLIIITFVFLLGAIQINTSFNFNSFIPEDNKAIKVFEKVESRFPFADQEQEYILLEGNVDTVDALQGIRNTHFNLEDNTFVARNADGSSKTLSIYTIIENAVANNQTLIEKYNLNDKTLIPESNRDVIYLYDYLWENEEYGFQTKTCLHKTENGYNAAAIRIYVDIVSEGAESSNLEEDLSQMIKEFDDDIENYGNVEAILTGQFVIWNLITESLTESQVLSTGISLTLAGIVLVIAYRRPTLGIIAMIPVLISIIWILGTMYFIGYSLDILTITVTSLTIGIGIDYAIHATERFRLVADRTGDINTALCETISRTGGALLIAALTTALGFAILVFAPIPPQVKFGVITAMTITYSFLSSVLILPLILARWAKWSKKKRGFIISSAPADKDFLNDEKNCKN
jgi:predicted RND superfamily exporter protein